MLSLEDFSIRRASKKIPGVIAGNINVYQSSELSWRATTSALLPDYSKIPTLGKIYFATFPKDSVSLVHGDRTLPDGRVSRFTSLNLAIPLPLLYDFEISQRNKSAYSYWYVRFIDGSSAVFIEPMVVGGDNLWILKRGISFETFTELLLESTFLGERIETAVRLDPEAILPAIVWESE